MALWRVEDWDGVSGEVRDGSWEEENVPSEVDLFAY